MSPEAWATLDCPTQGVLLVSDWQAAYGVESVTNRGPCPVVLTAQDANGNMLEPQQVLQPGESCAVFKPAGAAQIWAGCLSPDCEGETSLGYVLPGQA